MPDLFTLDQGSNSPVVKMAYDRLPEPTNYRKRNRRGRFAVVLNYKEHKTKPYDKIKIHFVATPKDKMSPQGECEWVFHSVQTVTALDPSKQVELGLPKQVEVKDPEEQISATADAKALAIEHKVNLEEVFGTGKNGKILIRDVRKYLRELGAEVAAADPKK